jgi:2'-5' RNA ligase
MAAVSGASGADAPARRLFLAVACDEAAREALAREQARLRHAISDPAGIRWTQPDQIHLTLVFLGYVAGAIVPSLVAACTAPIAHPPFTLTFGGAGVFPPRGAPRVLWIGALEGVAAAARVRDLVSERVQPFGIPIERRAFRPHLTVGRWRRGAGEFDARRIRTTAAPSAVVARVRALEVVLYESRLSASGSTYAPLARAPLTDVPDSRAPRPARGGSPEDRDRKSH